MLVGLQYHANTGRKKLTPFPQNRYNDHLERLWCDFTLMSTLFCSPLFYPRKCKLSFRCGSWVTKFYWLMLLSLLKVIFKSNSQNFLCLHTWHLYFYAVKIPLYKDILGWKWLFWGLALKEAVVFTLVW